MKMSTLGKKKQNTPKTQKNKTNTQNSQIKLKLFTKPQQNQTNPQKKQKNT